MQYNLENSGIKVRIKNEQVTRKTANRVESHSDLIKHKK